ncbi:hypothetical protein K402DRAFT_396818 [Aulographum hederae CBS 113979]|uniref:Ribosomal RNA-processing protein 8 n=1 Tax=Aulographum hederae CBS 113979 TaxID=1176131 RepID=A0A6G1GRF6_9PEZI|nr:hypothetical protein K402DRAFT_396818 [Aulographum hederae CBS 113979]
MFALSGWSVSTAPKALTEATAKKIEAAAPNPSETKSVENGALGKSEDKQEKGDSGKVNGKRKRKDELAEENLGKVWGKVVEGRKGGEKQNGAVNGESANSGNGDDTPDGERKKKRKRGSAGGRFKREREEAKGKNNNVNGFTDAKAGGEKEAPKSEEDDDDLYDEIIKESGGVSKKKEKKKKNNKSKEAKDQEAARGVAKPTDAPDIEVDKPPAIPAAVPLPISNGPKLTPLQKSMRQKLASARFRHLNETLYSTPSGESLSLFADNPDMFDEYHAGFRQQVEVWPENPVDGYVQDIIARAGIGSSRSAMNKRNRQMKEGINDKKKSSSRNDREQDLGDEEEDDPNQENEDEDAQPQQNQSALTLPIPRDLRDRARPSRIADLGCGDAALASTLQPHLSRLRLRIHSFDLHSPSPLVTRADIANLPLPDNSIDVAIFCLALMGTNWTDFVDEAYRVLRWKGECWVAEIKSRFGRAGGKGGRKVVEHSVGKQQKKLSKTALKAKNRAQREDDEKRDDEIAAVEVDGIDEEASKERTDTSAFVEVMLKHGFALLEEPDRRNKMFVKMRFAKAETPVKGRNIRAGDGLKRRGNVWVEKTREGGGEGEVEVEEGKVLKPCVYKLR